MISTFLNDINLNGNDKKYIFLLSIFSVLLTVNLILFHQSRGAFNSDIFVYLASALDFAGMNHAHISNPIFLQNSPVIFLVTSLLFRLGFVSINSIFIVTGCFGIIGIFGMYTFLKIRFSSLLSFLGAILYSSFSLTLFYFANGMLDTSAVALLIWTLIFTVVAVDKNPKYFVLVSISFVLSIFTRFTNFYIIFIILLYMFKKLNILSLTDDLINNKGLFKQRVLNFFKSSEFKWISISIVLGLIITFYVILKIWGFSNQLPYFSMAKGSISHLNNPIDKNYIVDKFFYLKNYLSLLFTNSITFDRMIEKFNSPSFISYLFLGILVIGLLLKSVTFAQRFDFKSYLNFNENSSFKLGLIIVMMLLIIFTVIGLKFNYLISLVSLMVLFIIILSLIDRFQINKDYFSLSLMCFGLFLFYFIVFSFIYIKCVRYILPTFPAFVYFVILSLECILNYSNKKLNKETVNINKKTFNLGFIISKSVIILLIVLLLFNVFNFTNTVEIADEGLNIDSVANFLINNDEDLHLKNVSAYNPRYFEWYFQKRCPILDDNIIDSLDYDYLISYDELENPNYNEIYNSGNVYLYERGSNISV